MATGSSRPVSYNLRKLYEMPFHLVESRMYMELRENVLFNYEWLHAKLCATSLPDVLADFQMTFNSVHNMDPVRTIPIPHVIHAPYDTPVIRYALLNIAHTISR